MNVIILHFMSPVQMKEKALHGIVLIVERIYMGRKKMSNTTDKMLDRYVYIDIDPSDLFRPDEK